jgi:hypothetical protein
MALHRRLLELPPDIVVLLRQPMDKRRTSAIDMTAAELAKGRGLTVEWFQPEPGSRGATYDRDYELISAADQVEAFFDDDTMPGGTGHVVDAALARNRNVNAWLVEAYGELSRIGEWETEE